MQFIVIRARFDSLDLPALGQDERSTNMGGKDGGMDFGNWDSYPKKDIGEREWDRSYNPPFQLPPQIYQPPLPPPEWVVPSQGPVETTYTNHSPNGCAGTAIQCVGLFLFSVLGTGLIWAGFRAASLTVIPEDPIACILFPMLTGFLFNGVLLLFFFPPEGERRLGDAESLTLLIALVINFVFLMMMAIAEKSALVASRFG